jgi:hypothetical protein
VGCGARPERAGTARGRQRSSYACTAARISDARPKVGVAGLRRGWGRRAAGGGRNCVRTARGRQRLVDPNECVKGGEEFNFAHGRVEREYAECKWNVGFGQRKKSNPVSLDEGWRILYRMI